MRLLNLRINFKKIYLLRPFCPHLGRFFFLLRFGQISPLAFFRWLTATSNRNAESCNRIPSNYCLPQLLSIEPRFWPSKPLAGLGRNWNRYLLTMLTWNRRDSTPLSAAPLRFQVSIVRSQKIAVSIPIQAGRRFTWSKTWFDRQQLWKVVITGETVTRLCIPIRGRG